MWVAACGGDVCAKYEAELECSGVTLEECKEALARASVQARRDIEDFLDCMFDAGTLSCDATMTLTEAALASDECLAELGNPLLSDRPHYSEW